MVIEHENIIYMSDIPLIGGTTTYVLEMAKKYKDLDIAVVYKTANSDILNIIRRYCKTYYHTNQEIRCKVALINCDSSICDYIKQGKIYMVIHADYSDANYETYPILRDEIDGYIGITKYICESFEKKFSKKCILSYNPLQIEKERRLMLISTTRLSKAKGKNRMIALANALDRAEVNYIWYVFTDDKNEIPNKNIVYMQPRIDVRDWIKNADYLVQLSDTEALSYSINEALYQNVPVIVTPLPYLDEIGVKDGINAYILNFSCKNVDDIARKIKNKPKFSFKHLEDNYEKILAQSMSHYKEDMKAMKKVRVIQIFDDMQDNVRRKANEIYVTNNDRADALVNLGLVEIVEEIVESIIETATKEEAKEIAVKRVRKNAKK